MATITRQISTKENVIDRYLADYEDERIDRETVARRVEHLSTDLRQLRNRRDELTIILEQDTNPELPEAILDIVRDRVLDVLTHGSPPTRKALCDALIAELRINPNETVTPVFKVPLTSDEARTMLDMTSASPTPGKAVRERQPLVELRGLVGRRLQHTNHTTCAPTCGFALPVIRDDHHRASRTAR